jgi:hypothetical protein
MAFVMCSSMNAVLDPLLRLFPRFVDKPVGELRRFKRRQQPAKGISHSSRRRAAISLRMRLRDVGPGFLGRMPVVALGQHALRIHAQSVPPNIGVVSPHFGLLVQFIPKESCINRPGGGRYKGNWMSKMGRMPWRPPD